MSKRLLNGICLLLFGGSILLVVAAFFIWNDPTEYIVEDSGGITQRSKSNDELSSTRYATITIQRDRFSDL